ncbi:MAG: tetratricopeptide repeat protein, partial [Humidesulfovibrio sp.]|nr:tetratricopeptide repeat protein [Humidesulfovibrio sp.]
MSRKVFLVALASLCLCGYLLNEYLHDRPLLRSAEFVARLALNTVQGKTDTVSTLKAGAEAGFADAQCTLGFLYAKGSGVPTDPARAAWWLRKAADQGIAWAQNYLGVMYFEGTGVPKNRQEAAKLYKAAADQGS